MKWFLSSCVLTLVVGTVAQAELLALLEGDKVNGPDSRILLDSTTNLNHGAALLDTEVVLEEGQNDDGGAIDFADGSNSHFVFNSHTAGAFDSILEKQTFTIAFWMAAEESAVAPRNQSVFWFESPASANRGIQSHIPWSNGQVYLDIGGCCSGTERVNGPIEREFWDSAEGEEWTHWVFTLDEDGAAAVYADGEEVLFRDGPTDEITEFRQIWWGGAVNGGNSFAGRLDDIIVADNALDFDEVETLYNDGPRALWDNILDTPADFEPAVPVIPNVDVNGLVVIPGVEDGDKMVHTINDFAQYVLTINGDLVDADHIVTTDRRAADNSVLDMTNAKIKVETEGELTVGDDFVLMFANEVTNIDTILWDFPDSGSFDLSGLTQEGGYRITYVGAGMGSVPTDCNGDGLADLACGLDGDFNLDGFVNFQDFLTLSANFGQEVVSYRDGDIDGSGTVDFGDFLVLSTNFGAGPDVSAVPEPSALLLVLSAVTGLGLLRKRR